jgi:NADH-quinone oxidoreductase subunit L
LIIQLLPLIVGVAGIILGTFIYKKSTISDSIARNAKAIYFVLKNKFFFDELFNKLFVGFVNYLSQLSRFIDINIIDRFGPNGFGFATKLCSWCVCQVQTGYIFNYALYIIFALTTCITIIVANYLYITWGI